jgi:signal transduction histidine kinase
VIEFGVGQDGGEPVYFIRDNGIGFAMTHAANRLFKPFQKLHDKLLYPGSGIGLATVNRVIRRSGGEIWAESEKGKGTTIFFTLG